MAMKLVARGVSYAYVPGQLVLHGVDLTVERGDLVFLLGANGSGKNHALGVPLWAPVPYRGRSPPWGTKAFCASSAGKSEVGSLCAAICGDGVRLHGRGDGSLWPCAPCGAVWSAQPRRFGKSFACFGSRWSRWFAGPADECPKRRGEAARPHRPGPGPGSALPPPR
jgi:hypothetical protein